MRKIAYEEVKCKQYHKREAGRNECARCKFLITFVDATVICEERPLLLQVPSSL